MDLNQYSYRYLTNGYCIIKNFLNKSELKQCRDEIIKSYKKELNNQINYNNIDKLLHFHEKKKDWDKMYIALKNASKSAPFKKISKKFKSLSKKIFKLNTKTINVGYAIGMKATNRTSYDWHQEKSYYSQIETIHYQFPFFRSLNKKNGTMSFLEKSHILGTIKNLRNNKRHKKAISTLIPNDIKNIKNFCDEKFLNIKLGDVCIFHQNIIHRSNSNMTSKIRFAGIVRQSVL